MSWWMIAMIGIVVWWFWPRIVAGMSASPVGSNTATLDDYAAAIKMASPNHDTAFAAMVVVRDRLLELGASAAELEQLTTLAPILLRMPPTKEA
jgi:hypothetical protein